MSIESAIIIWSVSQLNVLHDGWKWKWTIFLVACERTIQVYVTSGPIISTLIRHATQCLFTF